MPQNCRESCWCILCFPGPMWFPPGIGTVATDIGFVLWNRILKNSRMRGKKSIPQLMNLFLEGSPEVKQALLDAFGTAACLAQKIADEIVIVAMNDRFRQFYGLPANLKRLPVNGDSLSRATGLPPEAVEPIARRMQSNSARCYETREIVYAENTMPQIDGPERWSRNTIAPILRGDEVDSLVVSVVEITETMNVQRELEANLTHLIGQHLCICKDCMKIRNEDGEWQQLEAFMAAKGTIQFSHGICPSCRKEITAC